MNSLFHFPRIAWSSKPKRRFFKVSICFYTVLFFFATLQLSSANAALECESGSWPLWDNFKTQFIQSDGRVLTTGSPKFESFSEGQAYAMVFALIANDPKTFEALWSWSVVNLAKNNIETNLPAWSWGKAGDGSWKVLDNNSASDADLWFAYALLEAGRVWQRTDYTQQAKYLALQIENKSVVTLPGLGKMLLPGPEGFTTSADQWELNPSYLPIPVLRRLALENKMGPWTEIATNTSQMIAAVTPKGVVADWVSYKGGSSNTGQFIVDSTKGTQGSYDAIRVYLWAGMTPQQDPLAKKMITALYGMGRIIDLKGTPPEMVNVETGNSSGIAPLGFSAALLPYLKSNRQEKALKSQLERAKLLEHSRPTSNYYDYVLSLFGMGWIENRYGFSSNGQIILNWNLVCAQKTS